MNHKWGWEIGAIKCEKQLLSSGEHPIPTPKDKLYLNKVFFFVFVNEMRYPMLMPQGQTITANIYCQQLNPLQQVLVIKCPALVNQKWIIIMDSAAR